MPLIVSNSMENDHSLVSRERLPSQMMQPRDDERNGSCIEVKLKVGR